MKKITFITGASGVGKSTLLSKFKKLHQEKSNIQFFHFDDIGVPSFEKMIEDFGSTENWQKEMTQKWIKKLVSLPQKKIIIEGQVNLGFIIEGFSKENFLNYKIILIDCDENNMKKRLIKRGQKNLFDENMKNWLKYLRNQAFEQKISVISTSDKKEEESVTELEKELTN